MILQISLFPKTNINLFKLGVRSVDKVELNRLTFINESAY